MKINNKKITLMDNNNSELKPNLIFWEKVFSSFFIIKKFSKYFVKKSFNKNLSLSKLFSDLFKKEISFEECPTELIKIIKSKNKGKLLSNPTQLFNYILTELHNELKSLEKNEENKQIQINEYETDEKKAYDMFIKYYNNNRSFIEKLFFGIKKITKTCQNCYMSFYVFKFLKFCPINLENMYGFLRLKFLYKNIQRIFEKEYFCINCNKHHKFKIKTEIVSNPDILIFVLFNYYKDVKIDFTESLILDGDLTKSSEEEKEYNIKSFVMGKQKKNLLNYLFCCKKNNIKIDYITYGKKKKTKGFFKIVNEGTEKIDQKLLDKGNPYILFYKKKIKKNNHDDKSDNYTDYYSSCESNEIIIKTNKKKGNNNTKKTSKNIIISKASFENEKRKKCSKSSMGSYTYTNEMINIKHDNNNNNINNSMNNNINNNINNDINKNINNNINNNKNINNNIINNHNINNNINNNNNIKIENDNNNNINIINDNIIGNSSKEINNKSLNKSFDYNLNNEERNIRLYFHINDKFTYFLDTDKFLTFEEIITQLKEENEDISFEIINLFVKEKKIENEKSPIEIGIKNGEHINIINSLIDL